MILLVIPCPDKEESFVPALPPVTNYNLPAMEETQFLRKGERGVELGGTGFKGERGEAEMDCDQEQQAFFVVCFPPALNK